jgi:hypothetical protein
VEEQAPAQLEHVVARAGFRVGLLNGRGDDVPRAEDLAATGHAAVGVGAVRDDHVPEVRGGRVVVPLTGLVEDLQVSQVLRDVLVGVSEISNIVRFSVSLAP